MDAKLRKAGILLLGSAVIALFGTALVFFTMIYGDVQHARRIENLRELDGAEFEATAPGEDVLLSGVLAGERGSGSLGPVDSYAGLQDLVVYVHERWDVKCDESPTGCRGNWVRVGCVMPEVISIDGRSVRTGLAGWVFLSGQRSYSDPVVEGTGRAEKGIRSGSIRVVGYKYGDLITILGRRGSDGRLMIERFYGGSPEQAREYMARVASSSLQLVGVVMRIGLLSGFLGLLLIFLGSGRLDSLRRRLRR